MSRKPVQHVWCSGPMIAVFDAALDGDIHAIAAAQRVCAQCPMLDTCRRDLEAKAPKHRWGVQAGVYTKPDLPSLAVLESFPVPPLKAASPAPMVVTFGPVDYAQDALPLKSCEALNGLLDGVAAA